MAPPNPQVSSACSNWVGSFRIAAAKARGVKFGRPRKVLPEGFGEVKARWERGELSARAAGKLLGVTHRSFLLWAQDDVCKEIVRKT